MWAKLIIKGDKIDIYQLHLDNGECEGEDFFSKNPKLRKGFFHYLEFIADNGTVGLTVEQFKCWKEGCEMFCELKKRDFRIGCFQSDKKLLLVNIFPKKGRKEKRLYQRAVRLRNNFNNSPDWRR